MAVGVDVKNVQQSLDVNAVTTVFGYSGHNAGNIRSPTITSEQAAILA
jgi:hypothetical protein